jgi:hypothetical protein
MTSRFVFIITDFFFPKLFSMQTQFGVALYEDTACMIYDLLDAKRQWQNYLKNIHLLHVPEVGPSPAATEGKGM